jgi:AraC-like DNA-binding protein
VLSGAFAYRSSQGSSLMSAGALLLGNAGAQFECAHHHGEGDRCLSFQFAPELFEHLCREAGGSSRGFAYHRLPPLRSLAPLTVRAATAASRRDSFEEIALELAGAALRVDDDACREPSAPSASDRARVAHVLRQLESRTAEPFTLAQLARSARLSRYHFLRTFKRVTGITPHQWILRARLRDAARRLVSSRAQITEIALDVGFEDLSNFERSFHAEFGISPGRYRT